MPGQFLQIWIRLDFYYRNDVRFEYSPAALAQAKQPATHSKPEIAMETLTQVASLVVSVAAILAPAGAAAAGVVPRAGPGRALVLGLTSRFFRFYPASQRVADARKLNAFILAAASDNYIVVSGPKGVGKSRLVNSVVGNYFGVIHVSAAAATGHDELVNKVLREVARTHFLITDPAPSALRVAWFHKLFFWSPVTVVLHAMERKADEKPAAIDSAARVLVGHGLRVVVDASTNSMAEEAVKTMREVFLRLEPMERSVLERIEELAELLAALKETGLDHVVWKVLGGLPSAYLQLNLNWTVAGKKDIESVATDYMHSRLTMAISDVTNSRAAHPDVKPFYDLFVNNEFVNEGVLERMNLTRPTPDKVLRAVVVSGRVVRLVPADNSKRLVLRHKMGKKLPSLDELKMLS